MKQILNTFALAHMRQKDLIRLLRNSEQVLNSQPSLAHSAALCAAQIRLELSNRRG